jgi:hypothetical protein
MDHLHEIVAVPPPEVKRLNPLPGNQINLFLGFVFATRQHACFVFLSRDAVQSLAIADRSFYGPPRSGTPP